MFLESLVDVPAKIGLKALESGNDDLAKEAVPIIANMAKGLMSKEPGLSPYQPPRILKRAVYLGIYALKQGKTELVQLVKAEIAKFEVIYSQKYFANVPSGPVLGLPSPNQLEQEVRQLVEQFQDVRFGPPLNLGTARDAIVGLVDSEDVTRFADLVWPQPSPSEPENS